VHPALENAVARARRDSRTAPEVHAASAWSWAGLAVAAYERSLTDACPGPLLDAEEYASEAVEHAALSGDIRILAEVRAALVPLGDRARARWGWKPAR
jgi:hypothetical protein